MAQQTSPGTHAQRGKQLYSRVKQLRSWVLSDPSKAPELADTLNRLTAHRLLGHAYADAFAEAQEAFAAAYKLAPAPGTIGPLTRTEDVVRQVQAMAHLAMIQVAAGQAEAGRQTALAALALRSELGRPDFDAALPSASAVWLLTAIARGAAASGDLARANAYADAALARSDQAGHADVADHLPLAIDTEALVADTRWAAGVVNDAVNHGRRALRLQEGLAASALAPSSRLPEAEVRRLTTPLLALQRDLADRLPSVGDEAGALEQRRTLIARLRTLPGRARPELREALALALVDLADDLDRLGRPSESQLASEEAAAIAAELAKREAHTGQYLGVQLLAGAAWAHALVESDPEAAAGALGAALQRHEALGKPGALAAAYGVALLARAEVEQALDLAEDAADTRKEFGALAGRLLDATTGGRPLDAGLDPAAFVRDRARGVVSRSPLPTPHWDRLPAADALAEPVTSGSREAVIPSASTVTPFPAAVPAAPGPRPEPVLMPEPEPEVVPEPEPVAVPEPVVEPEPAASAPLDPVVLARGLLAEGRVQEALQVATEALALGASIELLRVALEARLALDDKKGAATDAERIVALVRPLAEADPGAHGAELVAALTTLSEARKRAGDWWGSLGPAREAKALAKRLR